MVQAWAAQWAAWAAVAEWAADAEWVAEDLLWAVAQVWVAEDHSNPNRRKLYNYY